MKHLTKKRTKRKKKNEEKEKDLTVWNCLKWMQPQNKKKNM